MHIYGDISRYGKLYIDIEEDGINSIIKVNKKDADNKSRKNIATDLIGKIPWPTFRFKQGILMNPDEKLKIELIDDDIDTDVNKSGPCNIEAICINGTNVERQKFKRSYKNVHLIYWKHPYEDMEYALKEGYRYLSIEESHHVINLIWPMIDPDHTIFYIDTDLFTHTGR